MRTFEEFVDDVEAALTNAPGSVLRLQVTFDAGVVLQVAVPRRNGLELKWDGVKLYQEGEYASPTLPPLDANLEHDPEEEDYYSPEAIEARDNRAWPHPWLDALVKADVVEEFSIPYIETVYVPRGVTIPALTATVNKLPVMVDVPRNEPPVQSEATPAKAEQRDLSLWSKQGDSYSTEMNTSNYESWSVSQDGNGKWSYHVYDHDGWSGSELQTEELDEQGGFETWEDAAWACQAKWGRDVMS